MSKKDEKLFLSVNVGSSSRKYALYRGEEIVAALHFEASEQGILGSLKDAAGKKSDVAAGIESLADAPGAAFRVLREAGYLTDAGVDVVVMRLVGAGDYFAADHIVNEEFLTRLEAAKEDAPLHIPPMLTELRGFRQIFGSAQIVAVSDTAFHFDKPAYAMYYPVDVKLAEEYDIKRYGYHGLSAGYVANYLAENGIRDEKVVVCHLGSGSSLTALKMFEIGGKVEYKSMDNTMGYTPLEGVMMATRSGSIDVGAAVQLKKKLGLDDDGLMKLLNSKSGFLGVSGSTNDMREVFALADKGDARSQLALEMFYYRVKLAIGQMAAALGGIDGLVFTATIGERNDVVRQTIVDGVSYLGFKLSGVKNGAGLGAAGHVEVSARGSKPVYVVALDETEQMLRRAKLMIGA